MKTKKKVLIGLMALCLVGTAGSALALTATPASGNIGGHADGAVYFTWGNEIADVSQLKGGVAQQTYFSAAVQTSKSVSGTVTLTFTLAADANDANSVLTGLTVSVYQYTSAITEQNFETIKATAANKKFELDASHLTNTATFSVVANNSTVQTTASYFAMDFLYDGTKLGASEVLSGSVDVVSSWA